MVNALPYDAEEFYYLIRMTREEAHQIHNAEEEEVNEDEMEELGIEEIPQESIKD